MSSAKIVVWVVVEGNEAEKARLDTSADITDLKAEVLGKNGREYRAYFQGEIQESDAPVPTKTTKKEPVILKRLARKLSYELFFYLIFTT